tara:strand:+ start:136 stop:1146 length:1011 start_codon:yes stop_codon:yes gene_type:complete
MSEIKVNSVVNSTGDNDSGLDLSTNDKIGMKIANSEVATIDTTGVVFNEGSADRDFRVESDAKTHAFFLEGSTSRAGFGTSSPSAGLHLEGTADNLASQLKITASGVVSQYIGGSSSEGLSIGHDSGSLPIVFKTGVNGNTGVTGSGTERMRIDSSGHFMIGRTSFSFDNTSGFSVAGSGSTIGQIHSITDGEECIKLNRKNSNGNGLAFFRGSTNNVGSINFGTSSVSYNTSSDYRLKENLEYNFDATTRLKQLKPCRFNFITDADNTVDGFLAHEVSSIVPEAISGEKDAVDADGNIDPQGIDQSKLVPLLVKSLQEAFTRIDTLEAEVKALKG